MRLTLGFFKSHTITNNIIYISFKLLVKKRLLKIYIDTRERRKRYIDKGKRRNRHADKEKGRKRYVDKGKLGEKDY